MYEIMKTVDGRITQLAEIEDGCWINMVDPEDEEVESICSRFAVDARDLKAALDEEERSRIDAEDGYTLILVDVPVVEPFEDTLMYATIPLGIIVLPENIITVCTKEIQILRDFMVDKVKTFYTYKKTRFILQILFRNASYYLQYLKQIDRMSDRIERELHKSLKNRELIRLLEMEKSLVYFSTSLRSNASVLEKMMKLEAVKKYPEDEELLEDVIIENRQAIEMASIYTNILTGMMDAFASVISNNLNIVMKRLTSITIALAIPMLVVSFYGMNVALPFAEHGYSYLIVLGIAALMTFAGVLILIRQKFF